ncbi:MAG: response regulator transcription factor [Clostridia bacterium]|nr:response regulator transcription factor [Clostridia bacterium]
MRILVCDDEHKIIEQLNSILKGEIPDCDFVGVTDIETAAKVIKNDSFDVAFIDIVLKNESGIDLGVLLQQKYPDTKLIFISGYQNKVPEIFFSVKPYGFIDKPINSLVVVKYLNAIQEEKTHSNFIIREKGNDLSIPFADICYIESLKDKVVIHTLNSKFNMWCKLDEVDHLFPGCFVRCHKSYLVNLKYVKKYSNSVFELIYGQLINVSRSHKKETDIKYFEYRGGIAV